MVDRADSSVNPLLGAWIVATGPDGTIHISRHPGWRVATLGCFLAFALLLGGGLWVFWTSWQRDPEWFPYLIRLGIGCFFVLSFVLVVGKLLSLLLGREQWQVSSNLLEVHARFCGIPWMTWYRDARLAIEARHHSGEREPSWYLMVVSGERKRELLGTFGMGNPSKAELAALAALLVKHTGWDLDQQAEPSVGPSTELPPVLLQRGWKLEPPMDGTLCLSVPLVGRMGCGPFALCAGLICLALFGLEADAWCIGSSLFWLVVFSLVLVAIGIGSILVSVLVRKVRWQIGRELVEIHDSGLRRPRVERFQGTYELEIIRSEVGGSEDRTEWGWRLQIVDPGTRSVVRWLWRDRTPDIPRALGSFLAGHTGWPVRERDG
jgi:hypothetical protein